MDMTNTILALATIKAICCRDEPGTRQLLRAIATLDDKLGAKITQRLYYQLSQEGKEWVKAMY